MGWGWIVLAIAVGYWLGMTVMSLLSATVYDKGFEDGLKAQSHG